MLKDVLGDVKVSDKGVYVQASTLGSLEALLQFLKTSEIPVRKLTAGIMVTDTLLIFQWVVSSCCGIAWLSLQQFMVSSFGLVVCSFA